MRLYFLQRWFNIAPWAGAEHIVDEAGEKFWIYWVSKESFGPELHVCYKSHPIGGIRSMWNDKNDGGLVLTDICILEPYKDLRRRGLGKRMLMRFIEQAKKEGAAYIDGFAKSHDGEKMDYILEWYKRQGFKVSGRQIFMNLD